MQFCKVARRRGASAGESFSDSVHPRGSVVTLAGACGSARYQAGAFAAPKATRARTVRAHCPPA